MSSLGFPAITDMGLFSSVDRAPDPTLFVRFVDLANAMPEVRAAKRVLLEALLLRSGDSVIDVGCGTGDDARELARRVGPDGLAVGVDASATMIDEARRRSQAGGVHAVFDVADAQRLPYADDTFHAARTERMLTHVPDPRAALAEMARVTRAEGRVCALDIDLDPAALEDDLSRALITSAAGHMRNPWVGGRLDALFADVGLTGVSVHRQGISFDLELVRPLIDAELRRLVAAGSLTEDTVRGWWAMLDEVRSGGRPVLPMTAVIVAGAPPC